MSLFFLFLNSIMDDFLEIIATQPDLPAPRKTPKRKVIGQDFKSPSK